MNYEPYARQGQMSGMEDVRGDKEGGIVLSSRAAALQAARAAPVRRL